MRTNKAVGADRIPGRFAWEYNGPAAQPPARYAARMMRRKVLQDFANVCCQMFLTSMANYDRINFVVFGSGTVSMDFLNKRCTHNRIAISPLHYCVHYYEWLQKECVKHHVDLNALTTAELTAKIEVETRRSDSGFRGWLTTSMDIDCSSILEMDAIEYTSNKRERQEMGLGQIIHLHTY